MRSTFVAGKISVAEVKTIAIVIEEQEKLLCHSH